MCVLYSGEVDIRYIFYSVEMAGKYYFIFHPVGFNVIESKPSCWGDGWESGVTVQCDELGVCIPLDGAGMRLVPSAEYTFVTRSWCISKS